MHRKTRQKEAILRVVKGVNSHPAADWIYNRVREEIPNISLGTVYRNLKLLKEEGKIVDLDLAGTMSRFNGNVQNHYHFRCDQCGSIFDVEMPVEKEIDERAAQKTGFEITHHQLEFLGLCKDCQQRHSIKGG